MKQTQENVKAEIAEIRARYIKLKAICGLQRISKETIESYTKEVKKLESKLKGGEER